MYQVVQIFYVYLYPLLLKENVLLKQVLVLYYYFICNWWGFIPVHTVCCCLHNSTNAWPTASGSLQIPTDPSVIWPVADGFPVLAPIGPFQPRNPTWRRVWLNAVLALSALFALTEGLDVPSLLSSRVTPSMVIYYFQDSPQILQETCVHIDFNVLQCS